MARRIAILVVLLLATPACRFSRNTSNATAESSTTESTVEILGDLTSIPEDTSSTLPADAATTTTAHHATTTTRKVAAATTRPPGTRAPAPAVPHCNASAGDTYERSTWTINVTSTFPSSEVVITISWGTGNNGSYSGTTDGAGSWSKTQKVSATMHSGDTVNVSVAVANRVHCGTSFHIL